VKSGPVDLTHAPHFSNYPRFIYFLKQRSNAFIERLTFDLQPNLPGGAIEESNAVLMFKLRNGFADRRGRGTQLDRSSGKLPLLTDFTKGMSVLKIKHLVVNKFNFLC